MVVVALCILPSFRNFGGQPERYLKCPIFFTNWHELCVKLTWDDVIVFLGSWSHGL